MISNRNMIGIALVGLAATMVYLLVTSAGAEAARRDGCDIIGRREGAGGHCLDRGDAADLQ